VSASVYELKLDRETQKVKRLRAALRSIAEDCESAVQANECRGKGGQQVPFHGPFSSGPPSMYTALRRMTRDVRDALDYKWPMTREEYASCFPNVSAAALDHMFRDEDK